KLPPSTLTPPFLVPTSLGDLIVKNCDGLMKPTWKKKLSPFNLNSSASGLDLPRRPRRQERRLLEEALVEEAASDLDSSASGLDLPSRPRCQEPWPLEEALAKEEAASLRL
ncbi:hypothetical protein GW17_00058148, partial [Ensete ventricosum]